MVVIMSTEGDKFLIFITAYIKAKKQHARLATIIVVLLTALLNKMMQQLKNIEIKYTICSR